MSELIISGTLIEIRPERTGQSQKGPWKYREFIIKTEGQYSKTVCFTAWNDKADRVASLTEGEKVTVHFNPESREVNGRWFTTLGAFRIESEGKNKIPTKPTTEYVVNTPEEDADPLPF